MTESQQALVRAAAEREAARCMAQSASYPSDQAAQADWWRRAANLWRKEAEDRIALGPSACQGWCGIQLDP
jgi:hypothetical protein